VVPAAFSCAAGGVALTVPGDVTYQLRNGQQVKITPNNGQPIVTRDVVTVPVYSGGVTTFDIDSAINGTTVSGVIRATDPAATAARTSGILTRTAWPACEAMGYKGLGSRESELVHGAATSAAGWGIGATQYSRVVRGEATIAGNLSVEYDVYASKVYSLHVKVVATSDGVANPAVWFMVEREVLVSVDSSRVATIRADTLVLAQDPLATGITATASATTGQIAIDIVNPLPDQVRVTCLIESTEISSVDTAVA